MMIKYSSYSIILMIEQKKVKMINLKNQTHKNFDNESKGEKKKKLYGNLCNGKKTTIVNLTHIIYKFIENKTTAKVIYTYCIHPVML